MSITIDGSGSLSGVTEGIVVAARSPGAGAQALTNNAFTTLIFDTEAVDTLGNYNPATGIFTCSAQGWYRFNWAVAITNTGVNATLAQSQLRKNGAAWSRGSFVSGPASFGTCCSVGSSLVLLAVGDTVDVQAYVSVPSGTATALAGGDVTFINTQLITRA